MEGPAAFEALGRQRTPQHQRRGAAEVPVQPLLHALQRLGEVDQCGVAHFVGRGHPLARQDPRLEGVTRVLGAERDRVLAVFDHQRRVGGMDQPGQGLILQLRPRLPLDLRGQEGKGINLPVRVGQGHADVGAPALKRHDVLYFGLGLQRPVAVGPGLQQQRDPVDREVVQRAAGLGGVDHDFAHALGRWAIILAHADRELGKARPAVLKHRNLEVGHRDLAGVAVDSHRRERVEVRRRVQGAGVARGVVGDPFPPQRVPAQVRVGRIGAFDVVGNAVVPRFATVEVELTAVCFPVVVAVKIHRSRPAFSRA